MSVGSIIRQLCLPCRRSVHRSRATAVEVVAEAIATGGHLSPNRIGRSLRSSAMPKHSIKRVDRLLSNPHLHGEWTEYYTALAERVLRGVSRPVIAIDWSGTVKGLHTLAAAVPIDGRAVTIYAEVHPAAKYTNRRLQTRFLQTLGKVLGPQRRPIIVADAGFRAPFINDLKALGWDWVTRVRGGVCVQKTPRDPWLKCVDLYPTATRKAKDLGVRRFTRDRATAPTKPLHVRLVLSKKPKRKGPKRPMVAPVSGMKGSPVTAAREPWLLTTSLDWPPKKIVMLYALRMQIEETFRDCKSHRLGWCLRHLRSRCHKRMTTLLMLATVAMVAVTMLGIAAERTALHLQYQANTSRRRVLSLFSLGRAVLTHGKHRLQSRDVFDYAHQHFLRAAVQAST